MSLNFLEKLRLACNGNGIKGILYSLVVGLCPLGIKLYGKYNELELIAIPALFEIQTPSDI